MLDTGCWILDAGYWMLDADAAGVFGGYRYQILDTGC
jgi:hypothetical protein